MTSPGKPPEVLTPARNYSSTYLHSVRCVRLIIGDVPADDPVRHSLAHCAVAGRGLELLEDRHVISVHVPAPDLPLHHGSRLGRFLHVTCVRGHTKSLCHSPSGTTPQQVVLVLLTSDERTNLQSM